MTEGSGYYVWEDDGGDFTTDFFEDLRSDEDIDLDLEYARERAEERMSNEDLDSLNEEDDE